MRPTILDVTTYRYHVFIVAAMSGISWAYILAAVSHKAFSLLLICVRRSACSPSSGSHGDNSCYLLDICTQSECGDKLSDCRPVGPYVLRSVIICLDSAVYASR